MSVFVRDDGFHAEGLPGRPVEIAPDTAPGALAALLAGAELVVVRFALFTDGRGFTLARLIRAAGFTGPLRAAGPLIADQYRLLRRAGFDEVEIPLSIAARQPEALWLSQANWPALDYRARLRGEKELGPAAIAS